MTKLDAAQMRHELGNFTGTEHFYRHPLNRNLIYTDGVKFFADNGAYWFIDEIALDFWKLSQREEFLHIKLVVTGNKANIIADDGNGIILQAKKIEFTDCPEGEWRFYLENSTLCLPMER